MSLGLVPDGGSVQTVAQPGWFNKRPGGAYALTATDAYWWHGACPCEPAAGHRWRQVSGRGEEGTWAEAWLEWLWRTHLEPRGFRRSGKSGHRVLDLNLSEQTDVERLRQAVIAGPSIMETAPVPPFDPERR